MNIEKKLADAIRSNNKTSYLEARYPEIQDGDEIIFEQEDFTGVNFSQFPLGFVAFRHCRLDNASALHSQPIIIESSSARSLNLSGMSAIINATDSDFTAMQYDNNTTLAKPENGNAGCSSFTRCTIDPEMKKHFTTQGVIFQE